MGRNWNARFDDDPPDLFAQRFCTDPDCMEERFPHLKHDPDADDIKTALAAIDHLNGHGAYVLTEDEDDAIKRLAARVYR